MLGRTAAANDIDAMKRLLNQGNAAVPSVVQEAMVSASGAGSIEALDILLQHGANIDLEPFDTDFRDFTPLSAAANHGQLSVVEYLIDRGANVNYAPRSTGTTPLAVAIDYEGDTASQSGETPKMACSNLLLEAGADPHQCNLNGQNAIRIARLYNFEEAIQRFDQHPHKKNP